MAGHWRRRGASVELRVYAGRDTLTGNRRYHSRSVPFVGKREAERELAAFVTELESCAAAPPARMTFGELLDAWFEARSADWSPATAYITRGVIDGRLVGLRGRDLRSLTAADLDAFYAALRARGGRGGKPLAGATVVRTHAIIRLALQQAVKWGYRRDNPALLESPGRSTTKRIAPPSRDDVLALLDAAARTDRELLAFLFLDAETGARRGELAALRFTDFGDRDVTIERSLWIGLHDAATAHAYAGHIWSLGVRRGTIPTVIVGKAPKTDRSIRTISLAVPTLEFVAEQRERVVERAARFDVLYPSDGFLFPATIDGTQPLRPDTWTARFRRLRGSVGLSCRLHDVRHFVATSLLTAGVDLATVAGRLGHGGGGKTTLAVYAHFLREPDRVASDVMAEILTPRVEPTDGGNVIALDARRRRRSS